MRLASAVVTLVVLATVLGSGTASARITPGTGMAGVSMGGKMRQVRASLGKPKKVRPPAWVYGAPLKGQVEFDHRRRVKSIWTASRRQRTRKGIGPGSSLRSTRRAYPRLRCYSRRKFRRCTLRRRHRHKVIATDFLFRGRLRIVNVHLLPKPQGTPIPK